MATSSSSGCSSTKEEKGILKLVHPGGHIETYTQPVQAAIIMTKNPRHRVTRPDVFKSPWLVVCPDSLLQPGKVFYIVPDHTIYHLLKTQSNAHQSTSSSSSSSRPPPPQPPNQPQRNHHHRLPRPDSPRRVLAGMTPKHGRHVRIHDHKRKDINESGGGVGCVQPSCLVPWNAAFAKSTTKVAAERQEPAKNMEKPRIKKTHRQETSYIWKRKKEKRGGGGGGGGLKSCLRQPGMPPKSRNRIVTFRDPEAIRLDESPEMNRLEYYQTQ